MLRGRKIDILGKNNMRN